MNPAIAIRIREMQKIIIACLSFFELAEKEFFRLTLTELLSSCHRAWMNLIMKLNRIRPLAHAKMHEENSKIP